MQSSLSVLTIILHIPKELWSSTRAQSHSVLMLLWSYPHTSWWLLLILFSWPSVQRLPLLSLQEAHTLLWHFLWVVHMATSSVSEHETQSPEAVSISESSTFSIDDSESEDAWSPVLFELPAAVPSSVSMVALVGLEGDWQVPAVIVQSWVWPWVPIWAAVFTPSLNLWGADMGPLVIMITEPTAGRAVLLLWCGVGNEPQKWALNWGSAYKGDVWQERY